MFGAPQIPYLLESVATVAVDMTQVNPHGTLPKIGNYTVKASVLPCCICHTLKFKFSTTKETLSRKEERLLDQHQNK